MKCKCGNEINVQMASRVHCSGAKILTSLTTILTLECLECGEKFQIPISSSDYVMKEDKGF
jgi:RNase P subunit RPR2